MPKTLLPRMAILGFPNVNYIDRGLRLTTGGLFGQSNTDSDVLKTYVWAEPLNGPDQRAGGICAVTGYWAPGHRLVSSAEGRVIDVFASERRKDR